MEINRVTCFGAGTIGCGWATNLLIKGRSVILYDVNEERLDIARATLTKMLRNCVDCEVITEEMYQACLPHVRFSCDLDEALGDADFIQESVPENLELKQKVIGTIEEHCRQDAIIATSTSGLLVADISAKAVHPERIIGAHPFNPVYLVPLVEIVKGEKTNPALIDVLVSFLKDIGKEPIVLQKEIPGFIANRLQAALGREARDLVYRGLCTVEDVDKAVVYGPGARWGIIGPHIVYELNGGEGGIRKQARQKGDTTKAWYADMAKWDTIPEGYIDKAYEELQEALAHRTEEEGRTHEELMRYRDKGLAMMLRFHNKI